MNRSCSQTNMKMIYIIVQKGCNSKILTIISLTIPILELLFFHVVCVYLSFIFTIFLLGPGCFILLMIIFKRVGYPALYILPWWVSSQKNTYEEYTETILLVEPSCFLLL